jgi:hypothetical protein
MSTVVQIRKRLVLYEGDLMNTSAARFSDFFSPRVLRIAILGSLALLYGFSLISPNARHLLLGRIAEFLPN